VRQNYQHTTRAQGQKRPWFAFNRSGLVTALDLDGRLLRLAQSVRRGNQTEIVRFAAERLDSSIGLPDADPEIIGAAVANVLGRLRPKPGPVVMGIPRGLVFLRTLALPVTDTVEELAAMIHFQISKDLPFRLDEAVVDFAVNPLPPTISSSAQNGQATQASIGENSQPPPKVEVLVAVVKNAVVQHYAQVAQAAGLRLTSLSLRSFANARCVKECAAANGHRTIALVSLRPDEIVIDVVVDQSLVFSRAVSVPRQNSAAQPSSRPASQTEPAPEQESATAIAAAPEAQADLISSITIEVARSLDSYEGMERHRPVEQILVAGDTGDESAVVSALAKRFAVPCSFLNPAAALGLNAVESQHGSGALAAFGLALGAHDPDGLPFDFLHPKRPPALRNWRRIKLLAATTAAAVLVLTLVGARSYAMRQKLQHKEQVQAQVTLAEKNRPLYRDMRIKAKTVQDWMAERRNWLAHYACLSALLPPSSEVYITSLSTGARGLIHLSVQARNGEILAQMDKRLREAGYEVKPLAITPGTDKYGYSFRSSVELTLPDKMRIDLSSLKVPPRPEDDGSLDPSEPRAKPAPANPPASPEEPDSARKRFRKTRP
jgi:Tfp pilus assembly PilM family ATPase